MPMKASLTIGVNLLEARPINGGRDELAGKASDCHLEISIVKCQTSEYELTKVMTGENAVSRIKTG